MHGLEIGPASGGLRKLGPGAGAELAKVALPAEASPKP